MPPRIDAQLLMVGPLIIFIGGAVLYMGYELPEARSFLWPFDGIIAILGGAVVLVWFVLRGLRLK